MRFFDNKEVNLKWPKDKEHQCSANMDQEEHDQEDQDPEDKTNRSGFVDNSHESC